MSGRLVHRSLARGRIDGMFTNWMDRKKQLDDQ